MKHIKNAISVVLIAASILSIADVVSGGEPIHEEAIIIFITAHWLWITKKKQKLPRLITTSYLFLFLVSLQGFINLYFTQLNSILGFSILVSLIVLIVLLIQFLLTKSK